jgi:hypothetical protein
MKFTTWKCPKCTAIGPINGGPCVACGTETTKISFDNALEISDDKLILQLAEALQTVRGYVAAVHGSLPRTPNVVTPDLEKIDEALASYHRRKGSY